MELALAMASKSTTHRAPIPGGGVNRERHARGPVGTEAAIVSASGKVMAVRQVVMTPLLRLLKQGIITDEEAEAGQMLRDDYDRAYVLSSSPMSGESVDGSSPDIHAAMLLRSWFGARYRAAMAHLGSAYLREVALTGIVHASGHGAFGEAGELALPGAAPSQRIGAGKGAIAQVARALAVYYRGRR